MNVRADIGVATSAESNPYRLMRGFDCICFDAVLFEKTFALSHILKGIQVQADGFQQVFLGFGQGAAVGRGSHFLTDTDPAPAFFLELKRKGNIIMCFFHDVQYNAFYLTQQHPRPTLAVPRPGCFGHPLWLPAWVIPALPYRRKPVSRAKFRPSLVTPHWTHSGRQGAQVL